MEEKRYQELAEKWLNGTISETEKKEFTDWYNQKGENKELIVPQSFVSDEKEHANRIWEKIQDRTTPVVKLKPNRRWYRIAVAAALLTVVASAYWMISSQKNTEKPGIAAQPVNDALPGRDAAILTLANGKKISLDSITGTVSQKEGITVVNTAGLLSYQSATLEAEPEYHTITTARGNQYQLQLPDGSKVWLNAASSLKYPTFFKGNERVVELSGEGYFEVAKNEHQPFHVKVNGMDVEVLGTHFNINSYNDEEMIRTTLLEGRVKVSYGQSQQIIHPGQQAVVSDHSPLTVHHPITIGSPDIDQVMAWKEGFFQFDFTSTKEMLRQLSRWYDVDIHYEGNVPDRQFGGRINRKLKLSEVIKMLQNTNVRFRIEGKNLIVIP